MNFLLITGIGTRGDVNPFISIGIILRKRGHRVTIISGEIYSRPILEAGLDFISYYTENDSLVNSDPSRSYSTRLTDMRFFVDRFLPVLSRGLYNTIAQFNPSETILLASDATYGARLAHDRLGFIFITLCLQPLALWSLEKPPVPPNNMSVFKIPRIFHKTVTVVFDFFADKMLSPYINTFRKELGLPNIHRIITKWRYSPRKVIGLFPEWLAPHASDWPKNTELVGFINSHQQQQDLPTDILQFLKNGSPPLLLTYGTEMIHETQFFKTSVTAVRQLGYRCLLLTKNVAQLPELNSENEMHIASYISLPKLLPHCAALAHHGGIGTLAQAIAAGIPQLVVPFFVDQPDNAARLKALNLCITVPIKKYTLSKAVNSLRKLLASPEIKKAALIYSQKIDFNSSEEKLYSAITSVIGKHS